MRNVRESAGPARTAKGVRPAASRVHALLALAVGLAFVACSEPTVRPPDDLRLVRDLLEDAAVAELAGPVSGIVFGTTENRRYLAVGWGRDQEDSAGTNVWAFGREAWLEIPIAASTDIVAEVEAAALSFEGAPPQDVEVLLGDRPVDSFRPGPALERHRVVLPMEHLRLGPNRIGFRFTWARSPLEVIPGNPDPRQLAVRFTRIGFRGVPDGTPPRASESTSGDSALDVPSGASGAWFFRCVEPAWIRLVSAGDLRAEVVRSEVEAAEISTAMDAGETWIPIAGGAEGDVCRFVVGAADGAARLTVLELHREGPRRARAAAAPSARPNVEPASKTDRSPGPPPDVLLYVVDTLRADHLSAYGYSRPTSPRLEELARDGIRFDRIRVHSSWTRTSMASLLTGRTPLAHGVIRRTDVLDAGVPVLAELLSEAGWTTEAWVTNGNVAEAFGLDRGFDRFHYLNESLERREFHRLADEIHAEVLPRLEGDPPPGRRPPRFLWLHATDPHAPYAPREPWSSRFAPGVGAERGLLDEVQPVFLGDSEAPEDARETWRALYDAEIASTDAAFGRLLDRLRESGDYENTLIVFTSDHGEEFRDHGGWEHGKTLYDEQLRVPLVIKLPGARRAGTVRRDPVRQVDVLPTILDVLGLPVPEELEGRSLLAEPVSPAPPVAAHVEIDRIQIEALVLDGWKHVVDRTPIETARRLQLYDVRRDPDELRDLWVERPVIAGWLAQELRRQRSGARSRAPDASEEADLDPDLRQRLEALGYLR